MPTVIVNGTTVVVETGTRLVNAIEDSGVRIGHRCGGKARCTTCRVRFLNGEPSTVTTAEHAKLVEREQWGAYRLACQILVTHDMELHAEVTLDTMPDWSDTGPRCADHVEPEGEFLPKP